MRILLVDGDERSSGFLKQGLSGEGFAVDVAVDAEGALSLAARIPYDALLVNGKLPERSAFAILAALRKLRCPAAVLMYSDVDRPRDKEDVILAGLDDFLTRPTLADLSARIYAALERARHLEAGLPGTEELRRGDLRMDVSERRVYAHEKEITLTRKEFELLECFMRHPGRVFSPEMIVQHLWDIDFDGHSNVVQSIVKRLRMKLGDRLPARRIVTIRGFGYRLAA